MEKIKFHQLKALDLSDNQISDINVFKEVNFPKLKKLNLCYNNISNINVLERVNFKELKDLNLSYNNINKNENYSIINNLKSKIRKVLIKNE